MTTNRTPGWYPLLLAAASIGVANSVVFTLLSDLQDAYHFTDTGLGLIAGTGFLVGLVGQLVFAPFADRGHSKMLLILGLSLAVVGSICFAFSTTLLTLIASRAVVGLSNSLFQPSSRAVTIAIGDHDMAHRLGTLSAVELAGFVTGPVIGGALVDPFGLKVPFLVAGSFALAGAVMLSTRQLPQPPVDPHRRMAFDLLRLPRIRAGILATVALFVPVGFYDATLDRYLTDMGASNRLIGFAFLTFGVPFALFASRGGRLSDRYGPLKIGVLVSCAVAPLTAYYGFITVPIVFVMLGLVEGILQSMGIPAASAIIALGAPEGRVAAAQGLAGAGSMVLGAATAYVAGPMYEHLGPHWMYGSAGAGVLLLSLLAAHQGRRRSPAAPTANL